MTTPPLSPAAQAAVNAHHNALCSDNPNYEAAIAAALRAAAKYPVEISPEFAGFWPYIKGMDKMQEAILLIANELDPQP